MFETGWASGSLTCAYSGKVLKAEKKDSDTRHSLWWPDSCGYVLITPAKLSTLRTPTQHGSSPRALGASRGSEQRQALVPTRQQAGSGTGWLAGWLTFQICFLECLSTGTLGFHKQGFGNLKYV